MTTLVSFSEFGKYNFLCQKEGICSCLWLSSRSVHHKIKSNLDKTLSMVLCRHYCSVKDAETQLLCDSQNHNQGCEKLVFKYTVLCKFWGSHHCFIFYFWGPRLPNDFLGKLVLKIFLHSFWRCLKDLLWTLAAGHLNNWTNWGGKKSDKPQNKTNKQKKIIYSR